MPVISHLVEHYRAQIDQMREDIVGFESGLYRIYEGPGFAKEITEEWIARKKKQLMSIERIIAAYEDRHT
jgi:hypothetical protein